MSVYRAFFSGVDSTGARQLWVTDGTAAGTTELAVTNAAATGLAPLGLTNFGNSILFEGTDAAGDYNLYISDGTAAGTTELTSAGANDVGLFGFVQLGPHGSTLIRPYVPQPFTVIGKIALFAAIDANDQMQLWRTDGTSAGTYQVQVAGNPSGGLDPSDITGFGGTALFSGAGPAGTGLSITDGTINGTDPLSFGSASTATNITVIAGGRALFSALDDSGNVGLWITDDTQSNITEIAIADPATAAIKDLPAVVTPFGDKALFTAFDASGRNSLWITDGTAAGTAEILPSGASSAGLFRDFVSIYTGSAILDPVFTSFGNKVIFDGLAADKTNQLWITDGTASGTTQLTTSAEGQYNFGSQELNAVIGGKLIFAYIDPSGISRLWVTDGTAAGTTELQPTGADPIGPTNLTTVGNKVIFSALNATGQDQLWVTNGTSAGTVQVAVSNASADGLAPADFLVKPPVQFDVYGNTTGDSVIEGTAGDDYIHSYGLGNTIYTNGGDDFINAGAGSDTVFLGGATDPPAGNGLTTINLGGTDNTVESYLGGAAGILVGPFYQDDQFIITGSVDIVGYGGGDTVVLGEGNAQISLGANNIVHVGAGIDTIRLTGGGNTVSIGSYVSDYAYADSETITLAGLGNVVSDGLGGTLSITGGGGNGTFMAGAADSTIKTTGFGNVVNVGNIGHEVIAPGDGNDTVNFGDPATYQPFSTDETTVATVTLKGQYNTVTGLSTNLTITGGSGHGTFSLVGHSTGDGGVSSIDYGSVGFQPDIFDSTYTRTYTITTDGFYNAFTLDDTNTNTIVAGDGYDSVILRHPIFFNEGDPPPDPATIPTQLDTVTFGGNHNTLTAANGATQVMGFGSDTTLTLGNGNNTLTLAGARNTITVGNGANTIDAGTGGDIVHLTGGTDSLVFHGTGNMAFLSTGVTAAITDKTPNLALDVLTGDVHAAITGFGHLGVVTLEAGTVTATTIGQVVAMLHSDGSGGTALALAAGGSFDFKGIAPGTLTAANFLLHP